MIYMAYIFLLYIIQNIQDQKSTKIDKFRQKLLYYAQNIQDPKTYIDIIMFLFHNLIYV